MVLQLISNKSTIREQEQSTECDRIRIVIGDNVYTLYQDENKLVITTPDQMIIEPIARCSILVEHE